MDIFLFMRLDKVKDMVILLKMLKENKEGLSPRQIRLTNYTYDGVLSLLKRWKEQGYLSCKIGGNHPKTHVYSMTEKGVREYDELMRMFVNFNGNVSQGKNNKKQELELSQETIIVVKKLESSEKIKVNKVFEKAKKHVIGMIITKVSEKMSGELFSLIRKELSYLLEEYMPTSFIQKLTENLEACVLDFIINSLDAL